MRHNIFGCSVVCLQAGSPQAYTAIWDFSSEEGMVNPTQSVSTCIYSNEEATTPFNGTLIESILNHISTSDSQSMIMKSFISESRAMIFKMHILNMIVV